MYLGFVPVQEFIHVVFCHGELLQLIPDLAILRIGLLLICQDSGIFPIQFPNLGKFPAFRLFLLIYLEGISGSFAKRQLFPVFFEELFAVPAFLICLINVSSLCIVDDVSPKRSDFGQEKRCKDVPSQRPTFRLLAGPSHRLLTYAILRNSM
jgi:hypothetical protein